MFKSGEKLRSSIWNIMDDCVPGTFVVFVLWVSLLPSLTKYSCFALLRHLSPVLRPCDWEGLICPLTPSPDQSESWIIVSGISLWNKPSGYLSCRVQCANDYYTIKNLSFRISKVERHTHWDNTDCLFEGMEGTCLELIQYKGRRTKRWRAIKPWCHTLRHTSKAVPHLDFSISWKLLGLQSIWDGVWLLVIERMDLTKTFCKPYDSFLWIMFGSCNRA